MDESLWLGYSLAMGREDWESPQSEELSASAGSILNFCEKAKRLRESEREALSDIKISRSVKLWYFSYNSLVVFPNGKISVERELERE